MDTIDLRPLDDKAFQKIRDLVTHIRVTGEQHFGLNLMESLYSAFDEEVVRRYSAYESAIAAGLQPSMKDYGLETEDTTYVSVLRSGEYPF